jgi:hypothetical protein
VHRHVDAPPLGGVRGGHEPGVADKTPPPPRLLLAGDGEHVQRDVHGVAKRAVLAPGGLKIPVQDDLGRPAARVGGEEARVAGDAVPRLADGAEAEDGLGRQADEDLRVDVLGEISRRPAATCGCMIKPFCPIETTRRLGLCAWGGASFDRTAAAAGEVSCCNLL